MRLLLKRKMTNILNCDCRSNRIEYLLFSRLSEEREEYNRRENPRSIPIIDDDVFLPQALCAPSSLPPMCD